jgi:hypothetical protein
VFLSSSFEQRACHGEDSDDFSDFVLDLLFGVLPPRRQAGAEVGTEAEDQFTRTNSFLPPALRRVVGVRFFFVGKGAAYLLDSLAQGKFYFVKGCANRETGGRVALDLVTEPFRFVKEVLRMRC